VKNLLLILLLANILYFLYARIASDDAGKDDLVVDESSLGPMLTMAERAPETDGDPDALLEDDGEAPSDDTEAVAEADSVTAAAEEDESEDADEESDTEEPTVRLQAVVGRACVSIGPFNSREDADRAQLQMSQQDYKAAIRSEIGERFQGHWVVIQDIPTMAEARGMIATLRDNGLGDAFIMETDEEGIWISLGIFGQAAGAERTELQVTSLGLPAVIIPRTTQGSIQFVDVALPPGRGAGAIVEQYGESRVLMPEEATCPR